MSKFVVSFLFVLIASAFGTEKITEPEKIKPGDDLQIMISDVPVEDGFRLNSIHVVSEDGFISLWGLGKIQVSGKTLAEVTESLVQGYREAGIYTDPVFSVFIAFEGFAEKLVTVGGLVKQPGPMPYRDNMTLGQAVEQSGGPAIYGTTRRVRLYRTAKVYTYDLTEKRNSAIRLYPNDAIEVLRVENFWQIR